MTNSNIASELPHPEPLLPASNHESGAALPQPKIANVVDGGRIRFGASYRAPSSK